MNISKERFANFANFTALCYKIIIRFDQVKINKCLVYAQSINRKHIMVLSMHEDIGLAFGHYSWKVEGTVNRHIRTCTATRLILLMHSKP